ncbi:hypothetical protein O181_001153 [Austropuccinia psidii MF-1]|uniref:Uncharacterized protein n=1 Tax=Austropuccinia psidii MF-1 TaxID=1389203 RepID=A0A9Q3GBG6_9BASI|nr:hypothetical protein [Austropuccinia psidii MF-1]
MGCKTENVSFIASSLSQFLEKPTAEHVASFKRVLQYFQGTKQEVLVLGGKGLDGAIMDICDLDWGSNFNGKSFSVYGLIYGGLIAWKTKKKPTVALSTTEAELKAMTELLQDIIWVKRLMINFKLHSTIKIHCDNQGAIALCQNPLYHHQIRHINIQVSWLWDVIDNEGVDLAYISTNEMWADILTKGLGRIKNMD